MQPRLFSLKQFIFKALIFIAFFYAFLVTISLLVTAYLFISLDSYKARIEKVVFKHTGYTLSIGSIQTGLSNYYLPEISITNAKLTNSSDAKQNFGIKKIQFVFSYSSIWNFEPMFDQINISGTDIDIEHTADGSFVLNGINLSHPDKKTVANTKKSPVDIEQWLLKQNKIQLSSINLSYLDQKNKLPKLQLYNIGTTLTYSYKNKHNLTLSLGKDKTSEKQILSAGLNWVGGKITKFDTWQEADLKIQSYDDNTNPIAGAISQYVPGSAQLIDQFNADTAIDAKIKKGKLQYFYANFDIKNIRYAISQGSNMINFPALGGSIRINLVNDNHYTLNATNLNISTPDGDVLANKNIVGNYVVAKNGDVSIMDTDLKSLNHLLALFPKANKLSFSGTLDIVKFEWLGKILHPTDFKVYANFKNIAITSKDIDIPSINNISGDVTINKNSGTLNLNLKNSTLLYPDMFLIPYKFKNLTSKLDWKFNKDKTFDVILNPTSIETTDFKGSAQGKYTYTPGTSGYLNLTAHVDKVLTHKVGDYLPIIIGMPVHKWLNNGLIGGYGQNASLILQGELDKFPFLNGDGKFYIDADINDGKLNYVDNWPPLENIMGKFQIRNQKILIMANSAKVSGNHIDKATVIIPDMTSHHVYLTADGFASGSTPNFMDYLKQTPINEIIGKLPERVNSSGNGRVEIHLNVPFSDPMHTKVQGAYDFIDNNIQFDLPVPYLTKVNGKLMFSEHGMEINKITTQTLNSNATLSANTGKDGVMHFKVLSPNLDYNQTVSFYLSFLRPVIKGSAPTTINFDIGKKGINQVSAKSNLYGVTLDAPAPLGKESSTISNLDFTMEPVTQGFKINYAYGMNNTLIGNTMLDAHGIPSQTLIAVGSSFLPSKALNSAKVLVLVNVPSINSIDWLETITKILTQPKYTPVAKINNNFSNQSVVLELSKKLESSHVFPVEVLINTPNVIFGSRNFPATNADVLVMQNMTIFNLNSTVSNGYGTFTYADKKFNILLNEFNILEAVGNIDKLSTANKESSAATKIMGLNKELVPISKARSKAVIESGHTIDSKVSVNESEQSTSTISKFPNLLITVNNLYYENIRLATFSTHVRPIGQDLLIESGEILSQNTQTRFHGANYCVECTNNKSFVEMAFDVQIKDFGQLLENLNFGKVVAKGSGSLNATLQWDGKFKDFNVAHIIATINVDMQNGKFLKVSTGSIFGEILGIINLQSITNITHLDFSDAFSNGFYFNTLKIRAYLLNNKLDIKSLYMAGPLAIVRIYGVIDINKNELDTYLMVTPKLGAGIAIGAAVATINPIVGIATYAAEIVLGEPFSKLFTFGYHITGSIEKPVLTKVKISQQVINNLNAAIGKGGPISGK